MTTIASIITSPGQSSVSIIRISGSDSFAVAQSLTGRSFEDHQIGLAWIYNPKDQCKIDQVIVLPFKAPHSYTGEDVIEIHSHGGTWLSEKILTLILESNVFLAKPGEFTERAFLNGKLDLSQAEAIMDLIEARTSVAGSNAIRLYEGLLGREIRELRENLINLIGALTAAIDFPDEVPDYDREEFRIQLQSIIARIQDLLDSEQEGHMLRNGYRVAIIGNPNAGKSTLLNTLLSKERAIVTDIPGTTRDLIEESYSLDGIPIILCDTAGIRSSDDKVEQIGIQKTLEAIEEADLVLWLRDLVSQEVSDTYSSLLQNKNCIIVGTKSDLVQGFDPIQSDINISSKLNSNIDQLKSLIRSRILGDHSSSSAVKINHRQADILRKAKDALEASLEASSETVDFWTIDLRRAILYLGEITGETLSEEMLDNIFGRFCIGK